MIRAMCNASKSCNSVGKLKLEYVMRDSRTKVEVEDNSNRLGSGGAACFLGK